MIAANDVNSEQDLIRVRTRQCLDILRGPGLEMTAPQALEVALRVAIVMGLATGYGAERLGHLVSEMFEATVDELSVRLAGRLGDVRNIVARYRRDPWRALDMLVGPLNRG